jgi:hypothetical protein
MPIDRLAEIAPAARISHARVVDAGLIRQRGMEMGFHLLRRGYDEPLRGRARHGVQGRSRPL